MESAPEPIVGVSLDGIITTWNHAAEQRYGYTADEVIGRPLAGFLPPAEVPHLPSVLSRVGQGETLARVPAGFIRNDGTAAELLLTIWPVRDRTGAVIGTATVTQNLTEEEELRAQLAAIADSSDQAIIGTNFDGIITSWSRGAERISGYTAAEMIGHSVEKLAVIGAPDPKLIIARLQRGEELRHFEGQVRRKDGGVADLRISLSPIKSPEGAVIGIAAVAWEPTEADRLRSQLAAIVESSRDAIIGLAMDGTVTSWNAGAEWIYGYTAREMIGQNARKLAADPELADQLPLVLSRLRHGEEPARYEGIGRRKDGSTVPISATLSPVPDHSGMMAAASATIREVSEADRLRSQLAAIVDSASESIIGLDMDGRITSWNRGAEQMYGYTASEMIGHDLLELVPPGNHHDTGSVIRQLDRGEPVRNYESRALRKDGTILHALSSMSAIRDRNGTMTGTALVSRDVSDRIRAEAESRAAQERQRQAERIETVSQLAGRVAHDFNNLLSTIMGYGGLVADATAGDPQVRADVQQILDAARRASRLSRDLLLISRREPVQVEALDLNRVLAELRGLLTASIGEHITLEFRTAAIPTVLADRGQFEQVVLNLAVNARDAMPGGGTLTFTTREVAGEQPPGGGSPQRYAELAVTDTGSGMSPEVASRAFEPFFTTKAAEEGTGLGLSTVHSLVTEAGGSVTAESEEGTGTTFRVRLPAASPPAATDGAGGVPREAAPAGHGERVLVVDDEPVVLEAAVRILSRNGYETVKASTAGQALSLLSGRDIQLMLADSVMPGMPGTALAERARELKPGVRILHMSGYRPPSIPGQPLEFLPKPFTAQTLLGRVREVLDAPAPEEEPGGGEADPPASADN